MLKKKEPIKSLIYNYIKENQEIKSSLGAIPIYQAVFIDL